MDLTKFADRGRKFLWRQTCTIKRSEGEETNFPDPTNKHLTLKCSSVFELNEEEKEKGMLVTVSRPLKIYTDLPADGEIKEHDVAVVAGRNYIVIKAGRWPHDAPAYYELIVEYRRGQ